MTAVIVTHNVGVATVVDQGKRSISSCTNLILITGGILLMMKHTLLTKENIIADQF